MASKFCFANSAGQAGHFQCLSWIREPTAELWISWRLRIWFQLRDVYWPRLQKPNYSHQNFTVSQTTYSRKLWIYIIYDICGYNFQSTSPIAGILGPRWQNPAAVRWCQHFRCGRPGRTKISDWRIRQVMTRLVNNPYIYTSYIFHISFIYLSYCVYTYIYIYLYTRHML